MKITFAWPDRAAGPNYGLLDRIAECLECYAVASGWREILAVQLTLASLLGRAADQAIAQTSSSKFTGKLFEIDWWNCPHNTAIIPETGECLACGSILL